MITPIFTEKTFLTNPGSPDVPIYSSSVGQDLELRVVQTGTYNVQDFINSFAETTSLASIKTRLSAGDLSVVNVSTPIFGDFTSVPTNLAELMQKRIDGERLFFRLPREIQDQYHNNPDEFIADSVNEGFLTRSGLFKDVSSDDSFISKDVIDKPIKEVLSNG